MKSSFVAGISVALLPVSAFANPDGLTVQSGSASAIANGNQLNVTASHNAFLNWQSFNIGAGQTTTFIQPSASSVVWNQINDQNPSQIFGNINANGFVVLMNKAGFYFGPNSFVSAAGLVVTTAPLQPVESGGGLFWQFAGAPPSASILNYGQINVGKGGSAFLIAERVENHGSITAPAGSVGLVAGQEVLLSERPDGRGLSATVKLPSGSVDNSGRLIADAGAIAMSAQVVNQNGLAQANTVLERNGIIELVASESIALGAKSEISAQGDASGISHGGSITIKSAGTYADAATSKINVRGGAAGGDGGFVEISAPEMSSIQSKIQGEAVAGSKGGKLVIDPRDIVIGFSGSASGGTVGAGDPPAAGTLNLDVNSSFVGFSQISLQATRDISLASGALWDLSASTGISAEGSLLKLEAGRNISIATGASIDATAGWSVSLQAGRDFTTPNAVTPGVGNIAFAGTGSLQAFDGNINLLAGNNITVVGGFVRTIGKGNIDARAVAGNINTGTRQKGFRFLPTSYEVDADLGGISTANGGNVSLTAGQDVISYLPLAGGLQSDAGSGAFGAAPGNVTVRAGRDVSGHFVVRNGTGDIHADRDAGTSSRLLALSLVSGGWKVDAERDILLQEVRNPNGLFNNLGSSSSANRYSFDYSEGAYTTLDAKNSVQLRGTALPRYSDVFSEGMAPIYPGKLEITAGAGGVVLGNDVTLFPSALGGLKIKTTDGGSLVGGKAGDLTQLVVSDSGKTRYKEFGDFGINDHAETPLHLNDPDPVGLDISGDMKGILLGSPKRAEIKVGGDMVNSRFDGQNLRDTDITKFTVVGNIINRNEFTSVTLPSAPDFTVFDIVYPSLTGGAAGVQNLLFYNATTKALTFQGRMNGDQLQALLNLQVRVFDANGFPVLQPNGEPVTQPAQFADAAALEQLYNNSQDITLNPDTGYRLGGGGKFDFKANNMDLGATAGIVSQGPRANHALAKYFTHGADIDIELGGNLEMFSAKIASLNGGDITVAADGHVNVGSRDFTVSGPAARGIFTTDPSDVSVIAGGDINLNGSRIAAYDGGNVTVKSLNGNVDAGTGGNGSATVEKIYVDPITRQVLTYAPIIPGSGILATTFPPSFDSDFPASLHQVGNITVETPNGNIVATSGGIVQLVLNGVDPGEAFIDLSVGRTYIDPETHGEIIVVRDINANGAGVIGNVVKLKATGKVIGFFFGRKLEGDAKLGFEGTFHGSDSVTIKTPGGVKGNVSGGDEVNVDASNIDGNVVGKNVTASAEVSGQKGFADGAAANATSQSLSADDQNKTLAAKSDDENKDILSNKETPRLTRTVGRVTVILPSKTN